MNTQQNQNQLFVRESEKFPKPRTMPEGWRFSSDESESPSKNKTSAGSTEAASNDHPQFPRSPEAFPGTDIYPKSWDLTDA